MPYKHDYDTILTRLTRILSRLNDGEALSVKELAEEFGVSPRTIQRDFNERLVSFPIYQDGRRWKMQEGHRIEKSHSIEDEIVLDIIEKITEAIGGSFATKSRQLLKKIKNDDFNPIYAKLNIEDISDKLSDIQIIETAIHQKREITCTYDDEKHPAYTTTLQPLKIVNFEGFWYLVARRNGGLRKYYLKNIAHPTITETTFTTDTKLETRLENSISVWFQDNTDPFEVTLFANAIATKFFQRRPLPTQRTHALHNDGTMEFGVTITHAMEILPIIKYWIPHLHIIEPKWIAEKLEEDLHVFLSAAEY
jgi:predicted DNA-binding transcriptional regulator YafY